MVKTTHGGRDGLAESQRPRVVSVVTLDGHDEPAFLALAASLARGLEAPLAAAILESARERQVRASEVDGLDQRAGAGVAAGVGGQRVVLGNSPFFEQLGLTLDRLGDWPERLRRQGQQVLFLAVDGRAAGLLGIAVPDERERRPDLKETQMHTTNRETTSLADLPIAEAPRAVELADGDRFDLRIAPVVKTIGADSLRMLAYNGSIPGPTLRVKQGSQVVVDVVNEGDVEATVHWHGLRLDNRSDGTVRTQSPIPVGGSFSYRLSFPDPGVYWYHPHIREDYGQEMGLYGVIVVVPAEPDYWPPAHRELTLTLDDLLIEGGRITPFNPAHPTFTAMGRYGNVLLANGETELALSAQPGEVARLYLTNTANTRVFNVALPGARMKLVGGDSGRCEREAFVERLLIAPSERAVVDVLFERPGELTLEHHTPQRRYRLASIRVEGDPARPSLNAAFEQLRQDPVLAGERARLGAPLAAAPDKTLAFVAEMDLGAAEPSAGGAPEYACPMHPEVRSARPDRCPKCGMKLVPASLVGEAPTHSAHGHGSHGHAGHPDRSHGAPAPSPAPAGIEWEDDMLEVNRQTNPTNTRWKLVDRKTGATGAAIDWRFRVGQRVKIRLLNELNSDHPMQHPFHMHGAGRFLVLSRDGVTEANLAWKDTVLVPTGQTVDILFEVTHPGLWMAHCHIAEHHESGMMLDFHVER